VNFDLTHNLMPSQLPETDELGKLPSAEG